jgi:hypothetical protein
VVVEPDEPTDLHKLQYSAAHEVGDRSDIQLIPAHTHRVARPWLAWAKAANFGVRSTQLRFVTGFVTSRRKSWIWPESCRTE